MFFALLFVWTTQLRGAGQSAGKEDVSHEHLGVQVADVPTE